MPGSLGGGAPVEDSGARSDARKSLWEVSLDNTTDAPPPYFAFRTLTNTLDLMKEKGVPNRVDRTFLVGMSGAGQTQFIAGLKSLGLIDANGNVQTRLTELAQDTPADRKRLLGEILRERYPEAVDLGTTNATTGQLMEIFKEYGVTGDTARKAIAFYLNAARYAGDVPLSPLFQTPKVTAGTGTRKRRRSAGTVDGGESNGALDTGEGVAGSGIPIPDFHPTLAGVLSEFPPRGRGWTKERRDKVMQMFTMAVDFTIPVVDEEPEDEEEEIEEEQPTL